MRTIALVTRKGGAGKTTVAASEAEEMVAALDLHPQGSLTAWGNGRAADFPAVDRIAPERIPVLPVILRALATQSFTVAILEPRQSRAKVSDCRRMRES